MEEWRFQGIPTLLNWEQMRQNVFVFTNEWKSFIQLLLFCLFEPITDLVAQTGEGGLKQCSSFLDLTMANL